MANDDMAGSNRKGSTATVREAHEGDAEAIARIGAAAFRKTFDPFTAPDDMARYLAEDFSVDHVRGQMGTPESLFLVADAGGEVVGFIRLNFGAAQTERQDAKAMEVQRLYVSPDAQGHGAGTALMDRAMEIAAERGCPYVWLGVYEHNVNAQRFYARYGFVRFGEHTFPVGSDPQTDWLMRRDMA